MVLKSCPSASHFADDFISYVKAAQYDALQEVLWKHTARIQQSLIKLLIRFIFSVLICFLTFCWFQLSVLTSAQLPSTFVFPPGTAFQAFGTGLLNSRLPWFSCWTLHRTIHGITPLVAGLAKELQLFWAPAGSTCPSLPHVTWRHCTCRLYGVLSNFSSIQHSLHRLRGCSFLSSSYSIHAVLLCFKTQNGEGQSQLSWVLPEQVEKNVPLLCCC